MKIKKEIKKFIAISLSMMCLSSCSNVSLANGSNPREGIIRFCGAKIRSENLKKLLAKEIYKFDDTFSQENFRIKIMNLLYTVMDPLEPSRWNIIDNYSDARTIASENEDDFKYLINEFGINLLGRMHRKNSINIYLGEDILTQMKNTKYAKS